MKLKKALYRRFGLVLRYSINNSGLCRYSPELFQTVEKVCRGADFFI